METGEAAKIVQPVYKADVSIALFCRLLKPYLKHRVVTSVLFEGIVVPFFLKVAAEMETGDAVQPLY